jgi:tRNA G10  N-methylase Trm11
MSDGSWAKKQFDIEWVEAYVNKPCYYTSEAAVFEFTNPNSDVGSVAINPRVSFTRTGKVFIDRLLVGKVDLEQKQLICKKIFQPELSSLFSNLSIKTV